MSLAAVGFELGFFVPAFGDGPHHFFHFAHTEVIFENGLIDSELIFDRFDVDQGACMATYQFGPRVRFESRVEV